jgi:peptide/nickel transport system ATP-binding protein
MLDADARSLCDGIDPELEPHGDARVACHHVDRNALVVA